MKNGGSFEYVRRYYGVPAKRGMRVKCNGKMGTITCGHGAHIKVRPDDAPYKSSRWICHPTWEMTYYAPDGRVLWTDPDSRTTPGASHDRRAGAGAGAGVYGRGTGKSGTTRQGHRPLERP